MSKIIVIVGPTGIGKTKLSIELAKKLNAEIINADSMQFYKDLNIGTAKIKEEEKEGIKHHLLDICSVYDNYNIYMFQKDGRLILDDLLKQNKNIIIVSGSGLYIKSLLYDYKFQDEPLYNDYSNLTNLEIFNNILKHHNTDIHINNRKRLVRELNKIENNNNIKSDTSKKIYEFITIGLTTERNKLYEIVNKRVDQMIDDGLIDEVLNLYKKNIKTKCIQTGIGYKELYLYFDSKITKEESIELIKKNTRNFIKRQYTFFNNQMDVNWLDVDFNNFQNTVNQSIDLINKYYK